jgi:uncharacterized protein
MKPSKTERGILIPHGKLSPEALQGLIEEFVTRDGTDSGYTKRTLLQNVAMVMGQLNRGEVVVVYDDITQTANLIPKGSHLSES